ncbi:MAG: Asp-tRNA(Asn)/Glu-tRNA(Gln) amidotransferase subunit GatA [Clostridiales bacterium]|jgi:aspartyl-tRNA(Asn)/glutamyl-tRNA(Gln) amidotransferase subunit A|nr:Asp-tRNA(Asn)/Glu-tRNA(Gln) amidotransferase subunit GatA [Clostridiales bacterium]
MESYKLTVHEASDLIKKKKLTSQELTQAAINRIKQVEQDIKAFITLTDESAMEEAEKVDALINQGEDLPGIAGVPFGLEDSICTEGIRTTCASKMLENFVPQYEATVFGKLKAQKGILLGKLNMDEFSLGLTGETSYFHKTRNPWDVNQDIGGFCIGAAAAVAADEVFYSLAVDMGGSLRRSAALCGAVGLKPSYGMVSRYGVILSASSLAQIGIIAKDVRDCGMILQIISGHDEKDPMTVRTDLNGTIPASEPSIKGMRIGIPREYLDDRLNSDVAEAIKKALKVFQDLGACVEEITLPSVEYAPAAYSTILSAEASSNLGRYDGIKFGYKAEGFSDLDEMYKKTRSQGFGQQVKLRIMLGNHILSAENCERYYYKALQARTIIKGEFEKAFEKCDIIISPTCSTTGSEFERGTDDFLKAFLTDIYTAPAGVIGLPALTIPCGFDDNGFPIGMQLMGRAFEEGILLKAGLAFEQNTDYHIKRPVINWR